MNPLFSRFIGSKEKQVNISILSMPQTLNSLEQHQRMSVVGWIANKLGELVDVESCSRGKLISIALEKNLLELNLENQEDYLLYLADNLVSWIENGADVYFNIKRLKLEPNYHKHLLEIYELVKKNPTIYFNKKTPDPELISTDDKIWEVYRDVLYASSQRKFLLINDEELEHCKNGQILCIEPVKEKPDIPKARNKAKEILEGLGLQRSKVTSYVLLISEGITNILKHAKDGRLIIIRREHKIHIIIEDKGHGFPLKILPYAVLSEGYSTKKSLGQGFTLMLKLADQILLKTSSSGSTIVLVLDSKEGEDNGKCN